MFIVPLFDVTSTAFAGMFIMLLLLFSLQSHSIQHRVAFTVSELSCPVAVAYTLILYVAEKVILSL